jgi:putative PIN family toxin of toxin-antitoxin system
VVVSPHLLYELQAVLSREKFRRYLTIAEVREYLLWVRDRAVVMEIAGEDVVAGVTPDPDDDYLIAVAIGSAAEVLVSGDSHLLDLETDVTSGVSTTIITPREFLEQTKRFG